MTRYKRSLRKRLANFYDDWQWWWSRNGMAMIEGFALGVLVVVIAFELAIGV